MTTWTLTTTSRDAHHTIIGTADTTEQARQRLIAATHTAIAGAGDGQRPRYTLHIDGQSAAIIQTGDDELGRPDHASAAGMLTQLDRPRNPYTHWHTLTKETTPTDIDYALNLKFIDDRDGRPLQLRFRCNFAPHGSPETFDGTGQLIAVVADGHRPDNDDIVSNSRPNVRKEDVDKALDDWQTWARITDDTINLGEIRRRIHAAGLDPKTGQRRGTWHLPQVNNPANARHDTYREGNTCQARWSSR